jgi:RNA polymerase sigma-70 factor (ECF subfamily)
MDNKKLATIYGNYAEDIYKYSMYKLRNKADAEDVTSEAFVRFMDKESKNEIDNEKIYLIGIARNVIYEKYRNRKKEIDNLEGSDEKMSALGEGISMEEKLMDDLKAEQINEKLKELKPLEQEIIILKVWEDLTFKNIAEVVEKTESAVKLSYYRSIEKLKVMLGVRQDAKKLYTFTTPVLLAALGRYKISQQFHFSSAQAESLLASINSLFNSNIMANTNNASNAAGSAATSTPAADAATSTSALGTTATGSTAGSGLAAIFASTQAKIGLAAAASVLVVGGGAGAVFIASNGDDSNEEQETSQVTEDEVSEEEEEVSENQEDTSDQPQETPAATTSDANDPILYIAEYQGNNTNHYLLTYNTDSGQTNKLEGLNGNHAALTTDISGERLLAHTIGDNDFKRQLFLYDIEGDRISNPTAVFPANENKQWSGYVFTDVNTMFYSTLTINSDTLVIEMFEYDISTESSSKFYTETLPYEQRPGDILGERLVLHGLSEDGSKLYYTDVAGGGFTASITPVNIASGQKGDSISIRPIATGGLYIRERETFYYVEHGENADKKSIYGIDLTNGEKNKVANIIDDIDIGSPVELIIRDNPMRVNKDTIAFHLGNIEISDYSNFILVFFDLNDKSTELFMGEDFNNGYVRSISNDGKYGLINLSAYQPLDGGDYQVKLYNFETETATTIYKLNTAPDPYDAARNLGWSE